MSEPVADPTSQASAKPSATEIMVVRIMKMIDAFEAVKERIDAEADRIKSNGELSDEIDALGAELNRILTEEVIVKSSMTPEQVRQALHSATNINVNINEDTDISNIASIMLRHFQNFSYLENNIKTVEFLKALEEREKEKRKKEEAEARKASGHDQIEMNEQIIADKGHLNATSPLDDPDLFKEITLFLGGTLGAVGAGIFAKPIALAAGAAGAGVAIDAAGEVVGNLALRALEDEFPELNPGHIEVVSVLKQIRDILLGQQVEEADIPKVLDVLSGNYEPDAVIPGTILPNNGLLIRIGEDLDGKFTEMVRALQAIETCCSSKKTNDGEAKATDSSGSEGIGSRDGANFILASRTQGVPYHPSDDVTGGHGSDTLYGSGGDDFFGVSGQGSISSVNALTIGTVDTISDLGDVGQQLASRVTTDVSDMVERVELARSIAAPKADPFIDTEALTDYLSEALEEIFSSVAEEVEKAFSTFGTTVKDTLSNTVKGVIRGQNLDIEELGSTLLRAYEKLQMDILEKAVLGPIEKAIDKGIDDLFNEVFEGDFFGTIGGGNFELADLFKPITGGLGDSFATSQVGQEFGFSFLPTGAGPDAIPTITPAGQAMSSAINGIPYGMIGSSLASSVGLGGGMGGNIGGMVGSMVGSAIPGLGIVGGIAGGFIGSAIGGLFGGGKKKRPFQGGHGNLDVDGDGLLFENGVGAKNYDRDAIMQATRQAAQTINSHLLDADLRITGGGSRIVRGQGNGPRDAEDVFQDIKDRLRSESVRGDDILRAGPADLEDLGELTADRNAIEGIFDPLNELLSSIDEEYDDLIKSADRMGLNTDRLNKIKDMSRAVAEESFAADQANIANTIAARHRGSTGAVEWISAETARAKERESYFNDMVALGYDQGNLEYNMRRLREAQTLEVQRARQDFSSNSNLRSRLTDATLTTSFHSGEAERQRAASQEMRDLRNNMEALGFTAGEVAAEVALLTQVQAAEADLVARERQAQLRRAGQDLEVRRLQAVQADALTIALKQQTNAAEQERETYARFLRDSGLQGEQFAEQMNDLAEVHAKERLAIEAQYNEDARKRLEEEADYKNEIGRQTLETQKGYAKNLMDWLDAQSLGANSTLSATEKFQEAQAQFNDVLNTARDGDMDALGRVTRLADAVLNAGRAIYASSAQYATLETMTRSQIESLGHSLELPGFEARKRNDGSDVVTSDAGQVVGALSSQTHVLAQELRSVRTELEEVRRELNKQSNIVRQTGAA